MMIPCDETRAKRRYEKPTRALTFREREYDSDKYRTICKDSTTRAEKKSMRTSIKTVLQEGVQLIDGMLDMISWCK